MTKKNDDGFTPGQTVTWDEMVKANLARTKKPEPKAKKPAASDE